ncbi:MAG: putative Fe-S cluster assembly protein SufT, partial [Xanthomonadales bacterium]|nr:putative Fe-S cluster assembly protein SufT [Xanthomonadales bacterium]
GMGEILVEDVRSKLEMIPTVSEADVDLVFDPPWNHSMMSDAAKLETGMF